MFVYRLTQHIIKSHSTSPVAVVDSGSAWLKCLASTSLAERLARERKQRLTAEPGSGTGPLQCRPLELPSTMIHQNCVAKRGNHGRCRSSHNPLARWSSPSD